MKSPNLVSRKVEPSARPRGVRLLQFTFAALMAGASAVGATSCIVIHDGPSSDVYESCDYDSDCPLGTECWLVTIDYGHSLASERMCTKRCGWDSQCAFGGSCQEPDRGDPLCYARCDTDADCHAGFACVEQVGDYVYDPVCMPW